MLNIFQLADNDQSVYYLGQVFGNVGIGLAGTGPALLGNMFKVLNTSLLALAAMIVTYTTVVGVLKTAHEGEFLGKQWSGLWVPFRMVLGIMALFPTKVGYCAIQVIFMWFIVQGVGAADMVWTKTVTYLGNGGAVQSPPPPTDIIGQVPDIMKQIFGNAVCQAAVTKLHSNDMNMIAHSVPLQSNDPLNVNSATGGGGFAFGRSGVDDATQQECGTVVWGSTDPAMSAAQGQAIQAIVPVMEALANSYVNAMFNDASCWNVGACTPQTPQLCIFKKYESWNSGPSSSCSVRDAATAWNNLLAFAGSNFMAESVKLFTGYANNYAVNGALADAANNKGPSYNNVSDNSYKKSIVNGWIFAGAYYYYIAAQNNGVSQNYQAFLDGFLINKDGNCTEGKVCSLAYRLNNFDSYPEDIQPQTYNCGIVSAVYCGGAPAEYVCPSTSGSIPSICTPSSAAGALGVADNAKNAMNEAINTGGGIQSQSAGASSSNPLIAFVEGIQSNIFQAFTSAIAPQGNSQTNPLVRMQGFGHMLLFMADRVFLAIIALALVFGALSTQVTAFGTTVNPGSGVGYALLSFLVPIAAAILGYMITIGGMLGVYMPLVPYTLFTFGAIGWFIAVIEAIIAAPLVGIAILSPGGHHEILGKAEGALLMLVNVFLRPTLMVFGMMAGMLLSYVVVKFINAAFYNVIAQMTGGTMGMIEGFLFLMAYAGLILTALNKCFSLIHVIPERTISWVGGHGAPAGEAEAAEAVKGKVMAGAGEAAGVGRAAGASAAKSAGELEQADSAAGREAAAQRKDSQDAREEKAKQAKKAIEAKAAGDEKKGTPDTEVGEDVGSGPTRGRSGGVGSATASETGDVDAGSGRARSSGVGRGSGSTDVKDEKTHTVRMHPRRPTPSAPDEGK